VRVLEELIYRFSTLLLYPALGLLIWNALRVAVYLGEACWDWLVARGSRRADVVRRLRALEGGGGSADSIASALAAVSVDAAQHPQVRRFAHQLAGEVGRGEPATLPARARHLAGEYEAELGRDVDRVRVLVRIGPCLGLAATLIPLGPGLAALGQGDLEQLSSQLVVAFSATAVGLAIGGVGYVLSLARARNADRVAADIELLGDLAIAWNNAPEGEPRLAEFLAASGEAQS
jgi:biopolymer transport protein ExbB/TolQ